MALDDGVMKSDQHFLEPMPCGTENLSPYSSASSFSDTPSYYSTEYDWQHQENQQPQQTHHHHQQQQQQHPHPLHLQTHPNLHHDSNLRYYGTFTDSLELTTGQYPSYTSHNMTQSDYFPSNPAVWAIGHQPDPNTGNNSGSNNSISSQHPKFFSGVSIAQQFGVPHVSTSTPTGASGKPKRKRVQSHSQRKAANVRERRRMFHLNEAFDELRKRLPAFNYEKRLSRIETLRLAMTYISFMKDVSVGEDPKCVKLQHHGDLGGLPMVLNGSGLGLKSPYSGMDSPDDGNTLDSDEL